MYLQQQGAIVELTEDPQVALFKADNGVPDGARSCHTALVGGYVVEGHVPSTAIVKLLNDRPDVVGLALPGMPSDSPGMGGDESTWISQDVLLIHNDGQLTPYSD